MKIYDQGSNSHLKLLEEAKIGKMELKNRVIMCPMGVGGLPDPDGGFSERAKAYYVERAKGGTGLIIPSTNAVTLEFEPELTSLIFVLDSRDKLGRLNDMVEEIHSYGSKVCLQLSAGLGRVCYNLPGAKNPPVAPSEQPSYWDENITCRALTKEEIHRLVKAFGNSAMLAKTAGVDAIEVHGYGGYLIDQFNSAIWNKRQDEYGGSLRNRLRFSIELIQEVKNVCGEDFPILYKFTPNHYIEGGRDLDEGLKMAQILEEVGVDALHVDAACFEEWHRTIPSVYAEPASQIDLSIAVREVVDIPVISHGKLGNPELAEKLLQENKTDFIALGRSLLADPDWVKKVEENRPEDIVPCIVCFEGCTTRVFDGKYVSCALNPSCGKELDFNIKPTENPKKVLVVGGGPGGVETALVASQRGHKVKLWEKTDKLGGNLIPASRPNFKLDVKRYVDYMNTQINKSDVDVSYLKKATKDNILRTDADVVVLATGGSHIVPNIKGIDKEFVHEACDVIMNPKLVKDKVVIVGAGLVGCDTALYLDQLGKDVTLIEMCNTILPAPTFQITEMALTRLIDEKGIKVNTNTKLKEVHNEKVLVEYNDENEEIKCDSVVLAMGFESSCNLLNDLKGQGKQVFEIGDAVEPRHVLEAVWEGFHVANII